MRCDLTRLRSPCIAIKGLSFSIFVSATKNTVIITLPTVCLHVLGLVLALSLLSSSPLQLTFPRPPSLDTTNSLAQLLCSRNYVQQRTQLSIKIETLEQEEAVAEEEGIVDAVPPSLSAVNDQLTSLDLPSACIMSTLSAARKIVPAVQHLLLRLNKYTEVYAFSESDSDSNCGAQEDSKRRSQQLSSLVLHMPPGEPPFCLCRDSNPLDLSHLPTLRHFVLQVRLCVQGAFSNGDYCFHN